MNFNEAMGNIADSIREKTGGVDKLKIEDMAVAIDSIDGTSPWDIKNFENLSHYFYAGARTEALANMSLLDISKCTNMEYCFYNCKKLLTLPNLNTENVSNFNYAFYGLEKLEQFPEIDTSNGVNFSGSFANCYKLKKIPKLNLTNAGNNSDLFRWCSALEDVFFEGEIKTSITFQYSPNLSAQSLENIVEHIATVSATRLLVFHADAKAKLTEEQIAIANQKGWTIS